MLSCLIRVSIFPLKNLHTNLFLILNLCASTIRLVPIFDPEEISKLASRIREQCVTLKFLFIQQIFLDPNFQHCRYIFHWMNTNIFYINNLFSISLIKSLSTNSIQTLYCKYLLLFLSFDFKYIIILSLQFLVDKNTCLPSIICCLEPTSVFFYLT